MPVFSTALKNHVRDLYSRWRLEFYLYNFMLGAIAVIVLFIAGGRKHPSQYDKRVF